MRQDDVRVSGGRNFTNKAVNVTFRRHGTGSPLPPTWEDDADGISDHRLAQYIVAPLAIFHPWFGVIGLQLKHHCLMMNDHLTVQHIAKY